MGCSPEDLPQALNDTEKWRERVRNIRAGGMIWWWWLVVVVVVVAAAIVLFVAVVIVVFVAVIFVLVVVVIIEAFYCLWAFISIDYVIISRIPITQVSSVLLGSSKYFGRSQHSNDPLGWGCRIHRLRLCRSVRHPQNVSSIWH